MGRLPLFRVAGVFALLLAATLTGAQPSTTVSAADIDRLQADVFEAATDLARLRTGDLVLLNELRATLDELRDEAVYLKVKLRKGQRVSWTEHVQVRDRIEAVRGRARSDLTVTGAGLGPAAPAPDPLSVPPGRLEIPARTEMDLRLLLALNPETARVGDRVEAATVKDFVVEGRVVVPAGSLCRGLVREAAPSAARQRDKALTVGFEDLTVSFRAHPIKAAAVQPLGHALSAGAILRVRFD
jgi:hypothetical protein